MDIYDEIIEWTKRQPDWLRDAFRRLLIQEALSDRDSNEILAMLKAVHGLSDPNSPAPKPRPVTRGDFGVPTFGGPTVTLHRMSGLKNVNALTPDQTLKFGEEGVTVIYGENATGKSGYARVLKKACRSRDQREEVRTNVFSPNRAVGSPQAEFDIAVGDQEKTVTWVQGQPPPEDLQELAVFDARCARLFVDEATEVTYMPYGLDVFTKLASLCEDLKKRLQNQRPTVEPIPDELSTVNPDIAVGKLISALSRETKPEEVKALASLSAVETRRLEELTETVKAKDPKKEADKIRRQKSRIERLRDSVVRLDKAFSDERLAVLKTQQEDANAAEQAARMASERTFKNEPLDGVAGDPWREMFKAAERYSLISAYPEKEFPVTEEGSRCVLCQQILEPEARERLRRFWNFIEEDTQKQAEQKRALFDNSQREFGKIDLKPEAGDPDVLVEIGEIDAPTNTLLVSYLASLEPRAKATQEALQTGNWISIPPLSPSPAQDLEEVVLRLDARAKEFEKAASSEERALLETELSEMGARSLLTSRKSLILRRIEQLDTSHRLEECIRATDTTDITRTQTRLMEEAVTDTLKGGLRRELKALQADHIKLEMKTTGRKGATRHQLVLPAPSIGDADLSEILSEGEHRAVAIASFMAELAVSGHRGAIVFDDPVSSLDNVRLTSLARRLVEEGSKRQVIIFTHNIVFLMALYDEADKEHVLLAIQTVRRQSNEIGICDSEVPWEAKQIKKRKEHLRKMIQQVEHAEIEGQHEELNRLVAEFYDRLRATWERAVEEVVFCRAIERFRYSVHTLRMDEIVFDDVDFESIHRGMTRCSRVTLAHDRAAADDHHLPGKDEMRQDLQDLEEFIKSLRKRQKDAKKRRGASSKLPS